MYGLKPVPFTLKLVPFNVFELDGGGSGYISDTYA
jgi:hypothetical protein